MAAFVAHQGWVAPMDRSNVDTDAMMPKQYLKCIFKSGYGDWAFDDWRYLDAGDVDVDVSTRRKNPDFELNKTIYQGASILLSRENFGCGSSREHAVWGIRDMGFKVVIATSFADIFYNNCFNNGILALTLKPEQIERLFELSGDKAMSLTVNLQEKRVTLANGEFYSFELEENRRFKMLNGLDNVATTLLKKQAIQDFEKQHKQTHPYYFTPLR
ncbi:3-isopropylmalate dehydratase small subunit [Paraglaciecola hydrolytica]|uniref:3-isopropylmalate dehydratase small subunit n=1 Tax=Paraglaciecola hydrolytica TaxID=1799789 RepID=A0A136A5G8_9ALTE|nr:3-isopropylmalate dehydratase small subunit [Paraglaciecola hydrolytica]KXI30446.1 3-isopropylmalate dehydratase [Paraglaciecola hydrolytica]